MANNIHGKHSGVKWNSLDITTALDKVSLDRMMDMAETTAMSTSAAVYKSRLGGPIDLKLTVSGPYDALVESTAAMETDFLAGTARAVKVQYDTTVAASATNPSYTLTMLISDFKQDAAAGDAVKWSATLELASGALVRATSGAW